MKRYIDIIALFVAAFAVAIALLAFNATDSDAHVITRQDCKAISHYSVGTADTRSPVYVGCMQHKKQHAENHVMNVCKAKLQPAENKCVIRYVFGRWGGEAVTVAGCESTWRVGAANGQYLGLFQMGSHERATYGHGRTALPQSKAAFSYFMASGHDWSPWECKPW